MNISVIIPVHEFNEKVGNYLLKALESIDKQEGEKPNKIIISAYDCVNSVNEFLDKNYHSEFTNIANQGNTDYQSQINFGIEHITTDYFSVLEFDDEYSVSFFKNSSKYVETYPEIDVFLTMMIEVNEQNQGIKLTNETVWAQQFVGENGEMGYLNLNSLKQYSDFKLS